MRISDWSSDACSSDLLTSPMGTAFVELIDGKGENLPEGSVIGLASTTKSPDVADLLASLSVVVTGGSFADIKTIIDEVNVALDQNTGDVRELMGRRNSLVTGPNEIGREACRERGWKVG